MSKNRTIIATLVFFLLVGATSLVMGATPIQNNPHSAKISSVPTDTYYTTIGSVYSSSTPNDNWAYINAKYKGKTIGWVQLTPDVGNQDINMITILNSAYLNNKDVYVYIKDTKISAVAFPNPPT